jgi:hydrogenase maturation protease
MGILIGGVGNVHLGDDGFGVEVVRRLAERKLPPHIHLVEYGIRGTDLAYAMLEEYERVIVVDALSRGGRPGTLYVIELVAANDLICQLGTSPLLDTHSIDPAQVLRLTVALGGRVDHVTLVGCEPLELGAIPGRPPALSAPVAAAVEKAIEVIDGLLHQFTGTRQR